MDERPDRKKDQSKGQSVRCFPAYAVEKIEQHRSLPLKLSSRDSLLWATSDALDRRALTILAI